MVRLNQESDAGGSEGHVGGLNPRSFAAFYERHKPLLFRWFLSRTHNEHLAAELTARTFLKAFEEHEQHRGTSEQEAVSWVLAIARTELLQFYRRGKVESASLLVLGRDLPRPSDEDTHGVEQLVDALAARTPLREALERLSGQQREAFERRFVAEESVAEVAKAMRISEIAVRTAVFRARRRLAGDRKLRRIVMGDPGNG